MVGGLRGDVLATDGAVAVLAGGRDDAGVAEGVAAGERRGTAEDRHADRTYYLLNLPFHPD